jgi:hypothetical protein
MVVWVYAGSPMSVHLKILVYGECKAYQPRHIGIVMARDVEGEKQLFNSLLANKVAIPDYQRRYVWKRPIITKLLNDLIEHSTNYPLDSDSPYFMGSLMLVPEGGATPPNVTDGQQRLTALTCIAAAVRDHLLNEKEYLKAWDLHCAILRKDNDSRLILHSSGNDMGTDAQVAWALKPRKFTMAPRVKMKLEPGTPDRLRTEVAINLPWNVCRVTFNKIGAMSDAPEVIIRGDPATNTDSFEIISTISTESPSEQFKACYVRPNDQKEVNNPVNTIHGGTIPWNEWRVSENRGTDTYIQAFNKLKKEKKNDDKILKRLAFTIAQINFTVSTFQDKDHAIQYFRVFNNPVTRVALNSGDELNAWVGELSETRYTDPRNAQGSYDTLLTSIKTSWNSIKDKLRMAGEKDHLPDFLNHYFIANEKRVGFEKTFENFKKTYFDKMNDGQKLGNRKTWNLVKIKDFFNDLDVAAGFYREIIKPRYAYHLGSRFKLLNNTSFKQWPPLMLACMISSEKRCASAEDKKTMNSFALAIIETLFIRGIVLPRVMSTTATTYATIKGNTDVYSKIPTWSKSFLSATNEVDLENKLVSFKTEVLDLLNAAERQGSFKTGGVRNTNLSEMMIVRTDEITPINSETSLILLRIDAWLQGNCKGTTNRLIFQESVALTTEHILPQTPGRFPWGGFATKAVADKYVNRIGNLMLLEGTDNSALSNSDIDQKFDEHPKSYSVLKHSHPKNRLLDDALSRSGNQGTREWNSTIVDQRGAKMADYLFECFDDPALIRARWN